MAQILIVLGNLFLKKLAKDAKNIDINLFFEMDDESVVKSVDFLEKFGTLYDLLTYYLTILIEYYFFRRSN